MAKKRVSKTITPAPPSKPVRKWARTRLTLVLAMVAGGGVALSLPFRKQPDATQQVSLSTNPLPSGTVVQGSRFDQIVPLADAPDRPIPAAIAPMTAVTTTEVAHATPPTLRSTPSLDGVDLSPELSGTYSDSLTAPLPVSRWSANRPVINSTDSVDSERFSGFRDSAAAQPPMALPVFSDGAAGESTIEHVIVDGDTLADLAQRYLGGAGRWPEIYDGNREVLADPELLPIGAIIRIGGSQP